MSSKTDLNESLKAFGLSGLDLGQVFTHALKNGGNLAELFFEDVQSTRVIHEGGKIDRVIDGTDRGVGLRILFENRSVYGYTTELAQGALNGLAEALGASVEGKAVASGWSEWRAPRTSNSEMHTYQVKQSPRKFTLEDKIKIVERIAAGAKTELPGARQITSMLLDSLRQILVVNSDGVVARDEKIYLTMVADVVGAEADRVETAHAVEGGYVGWEFFQEHSPESVGQKAAKRVKTLLSARPAPAGVMPVVMAAEAGGTMIHEAVGHGLEADLACNGLSVYQGKLGQQVASPLITVVDEGSIPALRGSYRCDDEGTPSQKTVLIENGVLKSYLVDRLSAMKFDLMATGNGRRESFRHRPIVRMTNTYIAPGKDNPDQILKDTKWGIYVKAMGGGQVNTVTGDFVFAVTEGYLIQDGKLGDPIRGATLVGNGPHAMKIIDRVGSDLGFSNGTCGKDGQGAPVTDAQPTLRIPEITVGGEVPVSQYWPDRH